MKKWVKLAKYIDMTGDTSDAVHARRKLGKWIDGKQCKIADGNLWVNIEEADKWVEQWGTAKALEAA